MEAVGVALLWIILFGIIMGLLALVALEIYNQGYRDGLRERQAGFPWRRRP